MATIGTFQRDGETLVGIITTRTVQARMVLIPDSSAGLGAYMVMIGMTDVGQAVPAKLPNGAEGHLVTLDTTILPGSGRAWLVAQDGYFVLTV